MVKRIFHLCQGNSKDHVVLLSATHLEHLHFARESLSVDPDESKSRTSSIYKGVTR